MSEHVTAISKPFPIKQASSAAEEAPGCGRPEADACKKHCPPLFAMPKYTNTFFVLTMAFLTSNVALAGGVGQLSKFNSLLQTIIPWLQGLALLGCCYGFIRAGLMYNSGDPSAREQAKGAAIGSSVIAGAAIIIGFIAQQFGFN